MSDAVSIRSIRSAPPSYDTALLQRLTLDEEEVEEPPRVVTEASLVVLAPPTNVSTDTLVDPTTRNISADVEARGPFTFSPFGPNAMLLLPHTLSSNSRPLYHISVSNDCFRPQVFTTVIRRGTEQGQVIARIQFSLPNFLQRSSADAPPGSGRPRVAHLDNIHFKRERLQWEWHFDKSMPLVWQSNCQGKTVISVQCAQYGVRNPPILATFVPSNKRGQLQTLDITSAGRPFMDNIVISCLATEGRRTTKHDK
ncbi:uncharacterized protein EDB91DRAFT_1096049 [Suillus paluster]|uniref:uncharacterized protein n=1 Tax=Suillus paluster TaxID=48578 RepID=UPI001B85F9E2|nr:uncharacterized protein EDB91DRAFT_1096049 [Suillus paluster]KAG1754897.1 hypothetical protein EDB91DRAFT_1096049 [Suillus paluster]